MNDQKNNRKEKVKSRFYTMANLCIFSGVIFLCQPLSLNLYMAGFPVILAGVVAYNILDHS